MGGKRGASKSDESAGADRFAHSIRSHGGNVTAGSFEDTGGTFTHTGGTLTVEGGTFSPGGTGLTVDGANTPTLVLKDTSPLALSGSLTVGYNDTGEMSVEDGAVVNAGVHLGVWDDAEGTLTVTGGNSKLESTTVNAYVGNHGKGSMSILDGGRVTSPKGAISLKTSSLDSSVLVDGPDSTWTCSQSLPRERSLTVPTASPSVTRPMAPGWNRPPPGRPPPPPQPHQQPLSGIFLMFLQPL